MKRSDIRNAYDSMTPTAHQKDKMFREIMENAPRKSVSGGKYQAQGSRSSFLSLIPAVAALLLVILAGAFVLGRTPDPEVPIMADPTTEAPQLQNSTVPGVYSDILQTCRTAIEEGWDAEKCTEETISVRFAASRDYARTNAGYQILDIDGNGTLELLIGHENYIWNLYTLQGEDTAVQLINDTNDGTVYQLCEGGHIIEELTTKHEGYHHCFTLNGISLSMEINIYAVDTGYRNMLTGQDISSEEALELIHKYDRITPELTWFSEISDYLREDSEAVEPYLPIIEKYKTALTENWSWEQCDAADISRQIMYGSAYRQNLGWCLLDIDGNGTQELIVSDGQQLFDLYALMPTDGQPGHILSGNEYSYSLCQDRTIERRITNGEFTYWTWFRFSETDYVEEETLILDNSIHRYYLGVDKENSRTITENEAGEYLTGDRKATLELTLTPFLENWTVSAWAPNYYYEPIIERYRQAIVEGWDPGKCQENGLSLMVGYYGQLYDQLGHNQLDLNGDGNDELIITDGTNIFDIYTVIHDEEDCAMRYALESTERNQYFMIDGQTLYCRGSGGAALTYHTLLRVGERGLYVQEGYLYDAMDGDGPWFFYDGETKGSAYADAERIVESFEPVAIPFVPFGDGGLVPPEEESEWEQAQEAAFEKIEAGEHFGIGDYVAWLIPWREQEFDDPQPLYYAYRDWNGDGVFDLILGYEDEVTAVWTDIYDEKAQKNHLTLLSLSEEEFSQVESAWATWDIHPIENFFRNEISITSEKTDK